MSAALSAGAFAHDFGMNLHTGTGSTTGNQTVADIMKLRNLKNARLDTWNIAQTRDMATRVRANGGRVQVSAQINFQWDNSCNPNLAQIESTAYTDMSNMINQLKDVVTDFEYLNEITLRPEIQAEVPPGTGQLASAYANKPCVATAMAALRGMSRALRDIRASSGLPLRGILGTVNRDFGFLDFAAQSGVTWDLTGYHIYPWNYNASLLTDPWFGTGGPIAQLAKRGKPITINEWNCGEIYGAGYENQAWATNTEACLSSIDQAPERPAYPDHCQYRVDHPLRTAGRPQPRQVPRAVLV